MSREFMPSAEHEQAARQLSVIQFAELFNVPLRLWGDGPVPRYVCAQIGQFEFLWRLSDGQYDGWSLGML